MNPLNFAALRIAALVLIVLAGGSVSAAAGETTDGPLYVARANGLWGFVNDSGKFVIPPTYKQRPEPFSDGLAVVQVGGKFGFIDATGNLAIPAELNKALPFTEGWAPALKGQYRGYLDTEGQWHLRGMYQKIRPFQGGLGVVRNANGRYELVDREGNNQLPTSYQNIRWAGTWPVVVLHDGEWYFVGTDGGRGIGGTFKQVYPSREGIYLATPDQKTWQFINTERETLFEVAADWVMPPSDGAAVVKVANRFHFVDMTGEKIGDKQFKSIIKPGFTEGLAGVRDDNGKVGFIDKTGQYAIEPRYNQAEPFRHGLALVTLNGRLMYINREGRTVWEEPAATEPTNHEPTE
jgi:hypothetical protein